MSDAETSSRVNAIESRLVALETQMNYISSRTERSENKLESVAERLARMEERVSHLPTKELIVKISLGAVGALGTMITFQAKLRALLGL